MHYCCDSIALVQRSNLDDRRGWCKIYLNADNNRQRLNYNMMCSGICHMQKIQLEEQHHKS